MTEDRRGIYIHVPFCGTKCPYCNFYSGRFTPFAAEKFTDAVCRNLIHIAKKKAVKADTLYFGGGTPSIIKAEYIEKIINTVYKYFDMAKDTEITLEANPGTLNLNKLKDLKNAGVNRLSVGVQSFCDDELKFLGRHHDSKKAFSIVQDAKKAGFENISADLMMGLPGQDIKKFSKSLDTALKLPLTHVSTYMLAVEEGTEFYKNGVKEEDSDIVSDIYTYCFDTLEENGFYQYEISNAAMPGFESRHNLKYWNCVEVIATGPSAHMFYEGKRTAVENDTEKYINSEFQPLYLVDADPASTEERLMLSLRTKHGLSLDEYKVKDEAGIKKYLDAGYIEIKDNYLSFTRKGFLVSNSLIIEISDLVYLN